MADKEIRQDQYDIELPQSITESFARFLVPEIRKYYDSEQGSKSSQSGRKNKNETKYKSKNAGQGTKP